MLKKIVNTIGLHFKAIWENLKKLYKIVKILIIKFVQNILEYFKDPDRLKKMAENKNIIAVAIKENLDNGNFNVINCLYDKKTETVVDIKKNALGYENTRMDTKLLEAFNGKDQLVLQ